MKKKRFNILKSFTLIDYIGVTLIVLLGLSFFLFFMRKQAGVNIRVKVTDQDVLYAWNNPRSSYANRFVIGDIEMDGLGRINAKIIGLEKFNITGQQKVVYLDIFLKTTFDKRSGMYYAKGKPLVYGTSLRFNFKNVIFDGIVTELPEPYRQRFYEYRIYELNALLKGINNNTQGILSLSFIEPEVIRSIKKGDKVSDSNGKVLFEVTNVVIRPSLRITTNDNGDVLKVNDPVYIDGILTLNVRAKVIGTEAYILDDVPLKINEVFPLIFDNLSVYPLIISFKEI